MCWHALAFSLLLDTVGTHWNHLEPILLDVPCPQYLKFIAALMCSYPSLSHNTFTCSGDLCCVLACVGILPITGYCWNTVEPPGTYTTLKESSWILLNVPCPHYLICIAALMCSYPPTFIQYIHMLWGALGCVGMRWHFPYYWILLEHIGTSWNHLEPMPPAPDMHSCTDV